MLNAEPEFPTDFNSEPDHGDLLLPEPISLVLDMHLRQLIVGDFVALPCFNSVVDRGIVVGITGSIVEFMILTPDTGIPETLVLDMRRPDPHTGLFGRYGYVGVIVRARKGQPASNDFARQLLATCEEVRANNPRFNPYLAAQARTRVEFLRDILR